MSIGMAQTAPHTRWWLPSLAEVVFVSVLGWVLLGGQARALLADGDTGWHIRTGDYILTHHRFPIVDLFSFSRPGEIWLAWEWGSDVVFSLAHRVAGLKGVVLLAGVLIAATSAALYQYLLWQGANVLVAVVVILAAGLASAVHWVARPHLFTYLFFLMALWLLEADRRRRTRWVWALVPLGALWANLHGGFVVLLGALGVYACGAALGAAAGMPGAWRAARRLLGVGAVTAWATLLNPYTYRLHAHIWRYLRSDFIRERVEEFQSPRFRGESMLSFEALLLAGLLLVAGLWRRREYASALLVVALAHAALGSVRHVLLYVLVAAPVVAREWSRLLQAGPGPWAAALRSLSADYAPTPGARWRVPLWGPAAVVVAGFLLDSGPPAWRVEFPRERFPQAALARAEEYIVGQHVFTSDQWGDYLIYRYFPRLRVFIDGRSDFYGPAIGRQYLEAQQAQYGWEEIFRQYGFETALLPAEWPLATVLKAHPGWELHYDDGRALLFTKRALPVRVAVNTPRGPGL
ncbi:MAG: hypothetical protein HY238_22230 [Acidobacteria bacterium]|nr:hypothetical protein [Acidobacteriota bacterium]